ncbi:HAAS signaling domain-containing protein [Mesobacillus thioparans]|uniref:HAAS signaling domain-containing protein n=1 Tax=Mesobacillus thioparans TaxID=370439 RepID=UPI0039EE2D66
MEMIEKYIYAVTHRLPQSQRADIAKELRGLIEDMLGERNAGGPTADEDVENILLELGNPKDLADKYRGSERYLIGPELFHPYITVLKIVIFALLIAMSVVFVIDSMAEPGSVFEHIFGYVTSVISASMQAFVWVTVGFAIAQYKGVSSIARVPEKSEEWSPSDLPPVPDEKKRIKRGEAITGIVFSILFLVVLYSSNRIFGVMMFEDGELINVIPFFNNERIEQFINIIYVITIVGILKEGLKLSIGKWTKKLALYNLLLNAVTLILFAFLFRDQAIWNPDFMQELNQVSQADLNQDTYELIKTIWTQSKTWVVIVFTIVLIIDTISGFYKAYLK